MADALATSANAAFAKLTLKHLTPRKLAAWADAFQFNRRIPFPVPTDISPAVIPEGDEVAFAAAGAGFGDVFMSPLHGAALASVAANRGLWRDPLLFEDEASALTPGLRVMAPEEAGQLADMMQGTIDFGTARRIFRQRGFRVPGAVGKTGSLIDRKPFRDYSWFVGYAPKDDPQVAVAALVVNDYYWRIRATWLGREAMRLALRREAAPPAPSPAQGRRSAPR
jgi:cell division protein FtsI/penicillin-binding protein 2